MKHLFSCGLAAARPLLCRLTVMLLLALLALSAAPAARAQCSFDVTTTPAGPLTLCPSCSATLTASATIPSFNAGGSGFTNNSGNSSVTAVLVQPDGKVLVGGYFTTYNGLDVPDFLVRLNADGSRDTGFNGTNSGFASPFANSGVFALAMQPNGQVLVGGMFTSYNGTTAGRLVRLNADGSRDMSFNGTGSGFDIEVRALAVQPNGQVLVAGLFISYNGLGVPSGLVRLNIDGSLDASFNGTNRGFGAALGPGAISALALQPNGQVMAGGLFTTYNNIDVPDGLIRLNTDGSPDASFNGTNIGFVNSYVYALALKPDGQLMVGGDFTLYNGVDVPDCLVRLNANGSQDAGFNSNNVGFNRDVMALTLQPNGQLLVSGIFETYNGLDVPDKLVRINANGSHDMNFNGSNAGFTGGVFALSLSQNGEVVTGGNFTSYNGAVAVPDCLTRLKADGSRGDLAPATPAGVTYTWSNGATGATLSVTQPGNYKATATSNGCTAYSNTVVVNMPPGDLVVSTPAGIPAGTYNNVTVTATGVATPQGNITINGALLVQSGGQLLSGNCFVFDGPGSFTLQAGATLGICSPDGMSSIPGRGSVQTTGLRLLSSDATYLYNGMAAQVTGDALPATVRGLGLNNGSGLTLTQSLQVRHLVRLANGNLTLNGQGLTLLSDATGTALIDNTGGVVLGNTATLQRHIETNIAANGYRHYASPMVAGVGAETLATLATSGYAPDFSGAPAYNSSATPGAVTPFPTVFLYNQDRIAGLASTYGTFEKGWQAALGTEVPQVGRGYTVQAPGAALVDFTGTLTSGAVSRSNLQRASTDPATGWHLLGNPYPSPLDWSTMSVGTTVADNLQNMDGAVYVFESSGPYAGSYRTYLASAPASGSPIIPAGSGFFVHTTTPATPGTVRFTGSNRVTTFGPQPNFGRGTVDSRPCLTLELRGATGLDALTVYADLAATPGFDATFDATKLANPTGLNLSAQAGSDQLAINGLPAFSASTVVPLNVGVPAAGTYALTLNQLLNLPAGSTAVLVDALLNTRTDLATLPVAGYAFSVSTAQAAALITSRFSLNLSATALTTATGRAGAAIQLYPNPVRGGVATLTGTMPSTVVTVSDALGRTVTSVPADAMGTARLTLPTGLSSGVYVVRAGTAAVRLTVE